MSGEGMVSAMRQMDEPEKVELRGILVDGPRGPEFVAQPDYVKLGLDDPEGRN